MDNRGFDNALTAASEEFKQITTKKAVRIISHLDADGICACSILLNALNEVNMCYSLSIVSQLTNSLLEEYQEEDYDVYFFTDLGSSHLYAIEKYLGDKKVFILDHHKCNECQIPKNVVFVNPHLCNIDGGREISGAGVVFFFVRKFIKCADDWSHLAIVGAIGDVQEKGGFRGLNLDILDIAIKHGKIMADKGLRWFGVETKPLYKLISYSTDPVIPGITGSDMKAIKFLKSVGIDPKKKEKWRLFIDLTEQEKKMLLAEIIKRRSGEERPEDIYGMRYIIPDQEVGLPTHDAREYSTLLNACGRLNKASLGIGTCMDDPVMRKKAIACLSDYRRELVSAIKWYESNKDTADVCIQDKYVIINAKDNIQATIIGTLASIISKSETMKSGIFVVTMARIDEKMTKVSMRISGRKNRHVDLRKILDDVMKDIDAEYGGHRFAAGAILKQSDEMRFFRNIKLALDKISIEERVF